LRSASYFRYSITATEIRMPKSPESGLPASLTPAVFHIMLALVDGPRHGYAIMQTVEADAGPDLRMGPGTIYGSLQRMEDAGLVREVVAEGRGRRRYTLTALGRKALEAEAARLTKLAETVRAKKLVPREA
jgi:DNA-binding PadR family transcriptional regulator